MIYSIIHWYYSYTCTRSKEANQHKSKTKSPPQTRKQRTSKFSDILTKRAAIAISTKKTKASKATKLETTRIHQHLRIMLSWNNTGVFVIRRVIALVEVVLREFLLLVYPRPQQEEVYLLKLYRSYQEVSSWLRFVLIYVNVVVYHYL